MTEVSVLIAESGARWSEWAKSWCGPSRELILLIQHVEEPFSEFRGRIEQGLVRVLRRNVHVEQVVFVGGSRSDTASLLARAQLVRAVLRQLVGLVRPPRLLLDAGTEGGSASRSMKALGEALADGPELASVALGSVRSALCSSGHRDDLDERRVARLPERLARTRPEPSSAPALLRSAGRLQH